MVSHLPVNPQQIVQRCTRVRKLLQGRLQGVDINARCPCEQGAYFLNVCTARFCQVAGNLLKISIKYIRGKLKEMSKDNYTAFRGILKGKAWTQQNPPLCSYHAFAVSTILGTKNGMPTFWLSWCVWSTTYFHPSTPRQNDMQQSCQYNLLCVFELNV